MKQQEEIFNYSKDKAVNGYFHVIKHTFRYCQSIY